MPTFPEASGIASMLLEILRNVVPADPFNDRPDGVVWHAKSEGYLAHASRSLGCLGTNPAHVVFSHSGTVMGATLGHVSAAFSIAIPQVVSLCAQEQVGWIAARRIIATMADELFVGEFDPMVQFVSEPMCRNFDRRSTADANNTVPDATPLAEASALPGPLPAFIWRAGNQPLVKASLDGPSWSCHSPSNTIGGAQAQWGSDLCQ